MDIVFLIFHVYIHAKNKYDPSLSSGDILIKQSCNIIGREYFSVVTQESFKTRWYFI